MDVATPLTSPTKASDPQTVRRWAAEHYAISIGLLHECPYHGEPFRGRKPLVGQPLDAVDPRDPLVKAFDGNARALYAAAQRLTGDYGERCPQCDAADQADRD